MVLQWSFTGTTLALYWCRPVEERTTKMVSCGRYLVLVKSVKVGEVAAIVAMEDDDKPKRIPTPRR